MKLALLVGTVCEPRSKRVRAIRFVLAMGEVVQCGRMAFSFLGGGDERRGQKKTKCVASYRAASSTTLRVP